MCVSVCVSEGVCPDKEHAARFRYNDARQRSAILHFCCSHKVPNKANILSADIKLPARRF